MRTSMRRIFGLGLVLGSALLVSCEGPAGSMNQDQLEKVRTNIGTLAPGMSRDAVLAATKPAHAVHLGSSVVDGVSVEEWKLEAYHDSGKGRDLLVRFCYFVDGKLVDASDRRIDFRSNPDLVRRWSAQA